MHTMHTPGPWQVVYPLDNLSITEIRTVKDEQTGHLATMGVSYGDKQTQANARLIAAAPDLLAACQMALEVIRRNNLDSYCGEDELTDPDGVKGIGDVLRAAIAKAQLCEH